jgi:hypothetical protein
MAGETIITREEDIITGEDMTVAAIEGIMGMVDIIIITTEKETRIEIMTTIKETLMVLVN